MRGEEEERRKKEHSIHMSFCTMHSLLVKKKSIALHSTRKLYVFFVKRQGHDFEIFDKNIKFFFFLNSKNKIDFEMNGILIFTYLR